MRLARREAKRREKDSQAHRPARPVKSSRRGRAAQHGTRAIVVLTRIEVREQANELNVSHPRRRGANTEQRSQMARRPHRRRPPRQKQQTSAKEKLQRIDGRGADRPETGRARSQKETARNVSHLAGHKPAREKPPTLKRTPSGRAESYGPDTAATRESIAGSSSIRPSRYGIHWLRRAASYFVQPGDRG